MATGDTQAGRQAVVHIAFCMSSKFILKNVISGLSVMEAGLGTPVGGGGGVQAGGRASIQIPAILRYNY